MAYTSRCFDVLNQNGFFSHLAICLDYIACRLCVIGLDMCIYTYNHTQSDQYLALGVKLGASMYISYTWPLAKIMDECIIYEPIIESNQKEPICDLD